MEPVDYEKVVADLEAKRATFNAWVDTAIQNMRQVLAAVSGIPQSMSVVGSGGGLFPLSGTGNPHGTHALTPDAFFGLSIAEAVIKYLQSVKQQQTTREITDALLAAKYHNTSRNFINTVNTALYRRERDEGDVVRIGRAWALTEWYPGRRRPAKGSTSEKSEVASEIVESNGV
jgi:hypothetical protein